MSFVCSGRACAIYGTNLVFFCLFLKIGLATHGLPAAPCPRAFPVLNFYFKAISRASALRRPVVTQKIVRLFGRRLFLVLTRENMLAGKPQQPEVRLKELLLSQCSNITKKNSHIFSQYIGKRKYLKILFICLKAFPYRTCETVNNWLFPSSF